MLGVRNQGRSTCIKKIRIVKRLVSKNISSDLQSSENEEEQFEQYKQITEMYLDVVLPETTQDITKANPKFNGDNLVSFLSFIGFDRVLASLKPEKLY